MKKYKDQGKQSVGKEKDFGQGKIIFHNKKICEQKVVLFIHQENEHLL